MLPVVTWLCQLSDIIWSLSTSLFKVIDPQSACRIPVTVLAVIIGFSRILVGYESTHHQPRAEQRHKKLAMYCVPLSPWGSRTSRSLPNVR